ncbi:MAG: YegS/Rv2252/BmrU family lipid kinase [Bacteroidota bacterium]|nr:YegS/Rv2252/BmrU family lipid kinase [Bacteroidota bacterium]
MEQTITRKERIAFIINPKSGTSKKDNLPKLIGEIIDQSRFSVELFYTQCAGHATQLTADLIERNFSRVIAVGGDGTVNEVAKALVGSDVALGIIPCGSGNGLGRFLNIPLKMKDALELQNQGKIFAMDYGVINENPFFCTCGVGFDAHIGNKFASSTKRGFMTYIKQTISAYFTYKPKKYKIKIDGEKSKMRAFLITVANAGQYGNDAYIAPQADIQDGLLDVCILKPFPKRKAFRIGFRLFNRTMDQCEYIRVKTGQTITIKRKKKGEVHLDGEPAIMGKKLKINIVEKGLKVVVPK